MQEEIDRTLEDAIIDGMKRRRNGYGTLFWHGTTWWGQWRENGRLVKRNTGETDRERALDRLDDMTMTARMVRAIDRREREIRRLQAIKSEIETLEKLNNLDRVKCGCGISLDGAMDEYWSLLENMKATEGTRNLNNGRFRKFRKFMEKRYPRVKSINQVDENMCREYLTSINGQTGTSSYNYSLLFLKRVWRLLKCPLNPWDAFEKEKGAKCGELKKAFTVDDLRAICEEAGKRDGELETIIMCGAYTGLREMDIIKLKVENVDFREGIISCIPRKTFRFLKKPIDIPLRKDLQERLYTLCKGKKPGDFIFAATEARNRENGKRFSAAFTCMLRKLGYRTVAHFGKIRKEICNFHSLRATFVSWAIESGIPALLIAKITGHSTLKELDIYDKNSARQTRSGLEALPSISGYGHEDFSKCA